MKKYLLSAILAISALCGHAEFNRIVFRTLDGGEQSVGITDLNISFSNGEMIATSTGESVKMELTELKSMAFYNASSGIGQITGMTGEGKVEIYSPVGIRIGNFDSEAAAMNSLPGGVYIVKFENGLTSKMLINR